MERQKKVYLQVKTDDIWDGGGEIYPFQPNLPPCHRKQMAYTKLAVVL